MTDRYKLLSLDEVLPGMSLSDDLLDGHGNVLLPRGATLTAAILASLHRHQIEVVPISFGELSEADRNSGQQHHRLRLDRLFRRTGDSESSQLLKQYMMSFRLDENA